MMKRSFVFLLLFAMIIAPAQRPKLARAGTGQNPAFTDLMDNRRFSVQFVSGVLFSPFLISPHIYDLDYFQTNLRFCWTMDNISFWMLRFNRNYEVIIELTNSAIYAGPGHYIGGVTALLRYTFNRPDARLTPYIQLGAGIVYSDSYKDETQEIIGQAINFSPQTSIGIHGLISKNWSVDIEGKFEHISNAGLDNRNGGVNAGGVFIGITYYFSGY